MYKWEIDNTFRWSA